VGQRYIHQRAARRDLAHLTSDTISHMELDGRRIDRAEDIAAVVRCFQEAEWSFTRRTLSREVPLALSLNWPTLRTFGQRLRTPEHAGGAPCS